MKIDNGVVTDHLESALRPRLCSNSKIAPFMAVAFVVQHHPMNARDLIVRRTSV